MSRIIEIDENHIWHPFAPLKGGWPIEEVERAEGCYIYLKNGRKVLDAIGSWWVSIHGHGNKKIAQAIYDQTLQLDHVIFSGFTHAPAVGLTERLLKILPSNQEKVFFSDDGSTAVEVGLKMALQHFYNKGINKKRIISIEGAYHGDTFGMMSVSGDEGFYSAFKDYMFSVEQIPFPNGENDSEVIAQFESMVASEEVAAFVYEPLLQGAAGMRIYSKETLEQLLIIAKKHGVLCVADEVLTGFGRTGKHFASLHMSTQPDITCLSKALTGGILPMGITTCSDKVADAYQTEEPTHAFYHGHSYTGNPISCAAGIASFDLYYTKEYEEASARISKKHQEAVERFSKHPVVANVNALGIFFRMEIKAEKAGYFSDVRKAMYDAFMERNLLMRPLGNVIYILPAFIIKNEELDMIYDAIDEVLALQGVSQ